MIAEAASAPLPIVTHALAAAGLPVLAWLVWRARCGSTWLLAARPGTVAGGEPSLLVAVGILLILLGPLFGALALRHGAAWPIAAGIAVALLAGRTILGPLLRPRHGIAGRLGRGLVAVWAVLPLVYGVHYLLGLAFGETEQVMVSMIRERRPGWELGVAAAVLLAPIMEETAFRGALYAAARRRWGPRAAIAVTAVLFGLVHVEAPVAVLPLALLGVALAWTVEATGSLLPAVVGHIAFNALTVGELLFGA